MFVCREQLRQARMNLNHTLHQLPLKGDSSISGDIESFAREGQGAIDWVQYADPSPPPPYMYHNRETQHQELQMQQPEKQQRQQHNALTLDEGVGRYAGVDDDDYLPLPRTLAPDFPAYPPTRDAFHQTLDLLPTPSSLQ